MCDLETAPQQPRTSWLAEAAWIALLAVLPLSLYLTAAAGAARLDGGDWTSVVCFEPGRLPALSAGRLALAAEMTVASLAFLFVVPGLLGLLLFLRFPRTRPAAALWSLALNSAALLAVCLLLRQTVGVNRASFAAGWLAWTIVLLAMAWRPGRSRVEITRLAQNYGPALLVGLAVILAAIVLLFPEQFRQCFNEDGTETRQLALSLRQHFLPYWELETWDPIPGGRLGTVVVNPSLVNSYWTCGLQLLLGENELPTRLPYWVWWGAIFAVGLRLLAPKGTARPPGTGSFFGRFRLPSS